MTSAPRFQVFHSGFKVLLADTPEMYEEVRAFGVHL
jgi:hypothetical protein